MSIEQLMAKASQAAASARILLQSGDSAGACNRAYYAMFDAASAALVAAGAPNAPEKTRTHSGMIHAFSLHVIKTGWLPKEFGQRLSRAHELRLIADYKGDPVEVSDALTIVEQAESFVSGVERDSRLHPVRVLRRGRAADPHMARTRHIWQTCTGSGIHRCTN